jgi:hypothetical protein
MKAFLLASLLTILSFPLLAQTCEALATRFQTIDYSRAKEVPVKQGSPTTFRMAYQECDTHNTFAGERIGSTHKCSTDRSHVDRLQVFPDETVVVTAKAAVDADGAALARWSGKSVTTQPETSLRLGGKSLDAEMIPYIVVPGSGLGISLRKSTGIGDGDLAVVLKGNHCSFAIVGDNGPFFKFGEISMAAQDDIGNRQCLGAEKPCKKLKGRGGEGIGIESGVTYIIFPHSRPADLSAQNARKVAAAQGQARVEKFFDDYGAPKPMTGQTLLHSNFDQR